MKVLVLVCLLIATAYAAEQCSKPLDLVLVVEDTNVLQASDEETLRKFAASIVTWLKLGDPQDPALPNPYDQAAYVLFNTSTVSLFHLSKYTHTSDARSAVLTQYLSHKDTEPAQIAQALSHVYNTELTVGNGERSCYQTVVVIISYSHYQDPNGPRADPKSVAEAADLTASRMIQQAGGLVITVGVGSKRNPAHLMKMASADNWYFDYDTFDLLTEAEGARIAGLLCASPVNGAFYPCEMQTIEADFTFVVDVSNEFTADYAKDIISFIRNFLTPYKYNHDTGVQAALVTYSKTASVEIYLNDRDSLDDFVNKANTSLFRALNCTECRTKDRCITAALEQVNYHVLAGNGFRSTCAVHHVYVFTAGCFNCDGNIDPIPVAKLIKDDKVSEIFVVTLQKDQPGNAPGFGFWKEPLEIATNYTHLYETQLDPTSILPNYLHKQSWRAVCVSREGRDCPTPTPGTTQSTAAASSPSTASPPPG